jgi:hypothetical protein
LSPVGDQSDVRDRVEDEETRSRTLSDAPLAILQRPRQPEFSPVCMHTRPGNWGWSRCLAPMCLALTANHHLVRIIRGPASVMSASTSQTHFCRRGSSLNTVAGDGLSTHRLVAVFPQDVTSLRSYRGSRAAEWPGQLRKSVKRPEWLGLSFPIVITPP